jgi:hypothetical protein
MKALSDGTPKYKYMFEAVANCVKAFKNGENKSFYQTDQVNFGGLIQ